MPVQNTDLVRPVGHHPGPAAGADGAGGELQLQDRRHLLPRQPRRRVPRRRGGAAACRNLRRAAPQLLAAPVSGGVGGAAAQP